MTELDSQAYFLEIEDFFIDLRGAPLLLSPSDWKVVREWGRLEVPLELIKETLQELIAKRRQRDPQARISGLKYFDRTVRKRWSERLEMQAPALGTSEERDIDVGVRLRRLRRALPTHRACQVFAEKLRSISGPPEKVELELEQLDHELVRTLFVSLPEEERQVIETDLEQALKRLTQRLPAAEIDKSRLQIRERLLRERYEIPLLSLFSPEANQRAESVDEDLEPRG